VADRTLPALLATGLSAFTRTKAEVSPVTSGGPLRELSGVGFGGGIRESFPGAWQRNITVEGVTSLLAFSPIYACVTRIANDIAKLGLVLMEEQAGLGISEPAVKTSPYWTVLRKPNGFQNRIQFVRQWLLSKLLFGNAYGIKFRDARGIVTRSTCSTRAASRRWSPRTAASTTASPATT
jgi:phage portal protein BeeE